MIIDHDLMVHLGLMADFKRQVLQWDGATVLNMEEPNSLIEQSFQLSARCAGWLFRLHNQLTHERLLNKGLKILDSTYAKADLKQVSDNKTQMDAEERTLLLSVLEDFEDLFDGTL